jgi:NAD(P)-dependent dehydrogenase (short-subunit alcohol dehydrogenase family)
MTTPRRSEPSRGMAVVTGAAQGIGRATAARLAAQGYQLLLVDNNEEQLAKTAADLGADWTCLDVADADAMSSLAELAPECTALINNVGITIYTPLLETTDEQAQQVFAVNVISILSATRTLAPVIHRNGGGSIVNLSSITARFHPPATGVYSTSKAAVEALTRALAVELGPLGIRCNAVAPGTVPTEGSAEHYGDAGTLARRAEPLPLRRLGTVEDIADAIAYFCSPHAGYVTGQVLAVDGGYLAAGGHFYRLARTAESST